MFALSFALSKLRRSSGMTPRRVTTMTSIGIGREARTDGVYAISGAFIPQGAEIYRPSRGSPRPVNAGTMILTSMLPPLAKIDWGAGVKNHRACVARPR